MKEIKNILFFIKYIKPQWKTLLTVIVLTIVATGIGLYLPIINSNLVDKGILAKNFDYVLNISIIYTLGKYEEKKTKCSSKWIDDVCVIF